MVALPKNRLRQIRGAKISMIFQEPMTSLNPVFTIGQQMTAGIRTHLKLSKEEAADWSAEMLDKVGIPSPEGTPQAIPARIFRWNAAEGYDCHGPFLRSDVADR